MAKTVIGRLRPHFFQICQPFLLDGSTCKDAKNQGVYLQDYGCQNLNNPDVNKFMIWNAHLSFPSGHASFICYAMLFTIFYMQRFSRRLQKNRINVGLLMVVLQSSCAVLAWFIALSRVMDYKHHWSDVLVGILVGSTVAITVSLFVRQQLKSVNLVLQGVLASNLNSNTATATPATATATTSFTTTMPNAIFVH